MYSSLAHARGYVYTHTKSNAMGMFYSGLIITKHHFDASNFIYLYNRSFNLILTIISRTYRATVRRKKNVARTGAYVQTWVPRWTTDLWQDTDTFSHVSSSASVFKERYNLLEWTIKIPCQCTRSLNTYCSNDQRLKYSIKSWLLK